MFYPLAYFFLMVEKTAIVSNRHLSLVYKTAIFQPLLESRIDEVSWFLVHRIFFKFSIHPLGEKKYKS